MILNNNTNNDTNNDINNDTNNNDTNNYNDNENDNDNNDDLISNESLDDDIKQIIFNKIKKDDNFDDYLIETNKKNIIKNKNHKIKILLINNINNNQKRHFNPRLPPYNKK
jgi:hypothetical protein